MELESAESDEEGIGAIESGGIILLPNEDSSDEEEVTEKVSSLHHCKCYPIRGLVLLFGMRRKRRN